MSLLGREDDVENRRGEGRRVYCVAVSKADPAIVIVSQLDLVQRTQPPTCRVDGDKWIIIALIMSVFL